jgi:hypothetical protein
MCEIAELHRLERGISTSDARAVVVKTRSDLTRVQGEVIRKQLSWGETNRSVKLVSILGKAIDACNVVVVLPDGPVINEQTLTLILLAKGNFAAIEAFLAGSP